MEPAIITCHLQGLEQTSRLAHSLAAAMRGGELLALEGDLGAGKTAFTRELTRALGCSRLANSPTFALFQRYRGGRLPILHGDFYRLNMAAELDELGWDELLHEFSNGVVVVEWANRFPERLPADHLYLTFQLGQTDDQRTVFVAGFGAKSQQVIAALAQEGVS